MNTVAMTVGWPEPIGGVPEPCPATAEQGQRSMPSQTGADSFDAFYGAAAMRVVRHCYALTGSLADAQDIAQEAFAKAWQRWASVGQCDSPDAAAVGDSTLA